MANENVKVTQIINCSERGHCWTQNNLTEPGAQERSLCRCLGGEQVELRGGGNRNGKEYSS